jgi:GNAT superfamily N-acetyltransferase
MRKIKSWDEFINENFNPLQPRILPIEEEDIPEVLEVCVDAFQEVDTPEGIREFLGGETDWSISKKCVIGDKIVGCYLFNEQSVAVMLDECGCAKEDYEKYRELRGIQGLGLALYPDYRGSGIGRMMRSIPLQMGYDYIWGRHLKGLHNVDQWIKFGRRVIGENEEEYVSLMDLV